MSKPVFMVSVCSSVKITLTRDMALSRQEEIDYLNKHGFSADFTKLKYSYNVGLWGTSICGGEILDSAQGLPESAYLKPALMVFHSRVMKRASLILRRTRRVRKCPARNRPVLKPI